MKTTRVSILLLTAASASATFAVTPPQGVSTLYGDWSEMQAIWTTSPVWSATPTGEKMTWTQGSYGIVSAVRSAGDSFSLNGLQFWGIRFDHSSSNDARWDYGSNANTVGAGGIEFTESGAITVGSAAGATRLKLTASQVWKGPDTTGTPAYFSVGHDNYQAFHMASATSTVDCAALTITGNLSTWFTWTNYFGETEIRVEKPARIWLEKAWVNNESRVGEPQLNAKKLTLSGDGVMWNAGGDSPVYNARNRKPQLETEMNVRTVAASLALEDGADLAGSGAGWDIPTLEVSGSGECAFTGDWTFRRARTDVAIASGATLALSGTCREAAGVAAGLAVTGTGTLKVDRTACQLTGAIDLGLGSTLEVVGEGLVSMPVTGVGRICLSGSATGTTVVSGKFLTGFSGTVEVTAGNVYFESLPTDITVETSGSGKVVTDADLPTYYGDWSKNPVVWTDEKGDPATPASFANIVVTKVGTSTCNFYGTSVYHGIGVSASRANSFWLSRADFRVGSGGIAFTLAGDLPFGGTASTPMLTLTSDQEWKGPSSGSDYATLQVGFPGYAHYNYHKTTLGVEADVETLKISGLLMAYFATTNVLSSVDVEIAAPAKLVLCDRWTANSQTICGDAHLGAKTLTLSGDGDGQLPLGASGVYYPYGASGMSTIGTLDADYVAGALVLKNGADLTASSPVRFDLPGLTVTGSGTSVLSGTFDIVRSSLAVALSDGATLDLAGTLNETQPGTTLSATGSGTVVVRSGYGLTGGISLGADVTLKVADVDAFALPVTGGEAMEISCAGKTLFVPTTVLSGFTGGTVTVTAGTVVFESVPAGVSLVEGGGIAKRATDNTDGTWLVTDVPRSESRITVGSGQTLTVCGSGLTDATELELTGGRVEFVRSTSVASPVRFVSDSSIGSVAHIAGVVSGFVVASNDNLSVTRQLSLSGKGTVSLAGGGAFDGVRLYVTEGSANLTGGHFTIARQSWGVYEGDYLGISGSATVDCPRSATGSYFLWCWPKYGQEAVLEIGTGGVVRLNHNVGLLVGRSDNTVDMPGTFRLSGGSLTLSRSYRMALGGQDGGRGRIELLDGEFVTDQCLQVPYTNNAAADIAWYGGTIKLGDEYTTWVGNAGKTTLDGTSSNLTFRLLGPNCRLDLNGVTAFTNVLANAENAASWTAVAGSCLTVANGGTCVFQRFPAGGTIGVDGCSALIDDPANPQVSTVVFRGTGADVVRTTSATMQDVSVVVATDGVWGAGQLEGLAVDDLSFEDGAGLRLFLREDGTVIPLSIPGSVTCGGVLGVDFVRTGRLPPAGSSVLLSAAGGLTAPTSFVSLSKATRGATFAAEGNDLVANIVRPGMCLIFR